MTDLHAWAQRHGVSPVAVAELRALMNSDLIHTGVSLDPRGGSENAQQNLIRLEAPRFGIWLTRNNVGCLMDETGRPVRYGLANESKAQNDVVKSADLIGIYTFTVEPRHVGMTVGQFASVECKERGWKYKGTKREKAQRTWAEFVVSKGGIACFASEPHHLQNLGVQRK